MLQRPPLVSFTAMTPPTDTQFYAQMTLIRQTEQAFFDLYARGLMAGTVHTSIGQEACAVGVVAALDQERDVIFSSHRAHGHFLAYCDDVDGLVAELLGRRTGVVGGVGGTQHLHTRNLYTNGIQGGIVPNAVGAALAEKLAGSGAIVTVFLGDGTMGEGVVYESMNLASLWQLPVLFVLEDNHYAQSTPKHLEHAGSLADRPRAFGIATHDLTGGSAHTMAAALDVTEIYAAACTAVTHVRERGAPYFLALPTYRLAPHSKGDDTRQRDELAAAWDRDPLERLGGRLEPGERARLDAAAAARAEGDRRCPGRNTPVAYPICRGSTMAARLTYLESLRTGLHTILEQDPRAVVLGEDILDPYGGAFKVTQGLSTRFPDRVFTTPISEAAIVGVSVGLALRGRHPIAEIMFGDFVTLAADQLINHAAKYAAMYNGQVRVPLVVRTPDGRRPRLWPDAQPVARAPLSRHPPSHGARTLARA